ncbi:MAG: type II toxin-antitoxin system MqsA family antitoxin [Ktedonobacterales bacterium]|nr:type II toxin-antitoxin system MqsA family antitoxin [Ktedonobacterales bacterium]
MKCVACKEGTTQPGFITVTLERDMATIVVKRVPAEVCTNCGEGYVDGVISARLLKTAEEAINGGVQVDVRQYIAA